MTRNVFKVTRGIEDSMSLVSATVQVSFVERVSQIDHRTAKPLGVSIQVVLMTTSIFTAVIEFAIEGPGEVAAQAIKSSNCIAEITAVIAAVSVVVILVT